MSETEPSTNLFIPADESEWFKKLFFPFTKWFFRVRFKKIWVNQNYVPKKDSRSIYYLNHSSWWDGLIPVLLTTTLLPQKARAMMGEKQMIRYRFFRKLGAFSVSLDRPHSTRRMLRYATSSLKHPGTSLFIYPEGHMVPFSIEKPRFQNGIIWLKRQLPDVDLVPIGIYIHTIRHNRPELHIQIGEKIDIDLKDLEDHKREPEAPYTRRKEPVNCNEMTLGSGSLIRRSSVGNYHPDLTSVDGKANPGPSSVVGKPTNPDLLNRHDSGTELHTMSAAGTAKTILELSLQEQLIDLQRYSGFNDSHFTRLM